MDEEAVEGKYDDEENDRSTLNIRSCGDVDVCEPGRSERGECSGRTGGGGPNKLLKGGSCCLGAVGAASLGVSSSSELFAEAISALVVGS